MKTVCDSPATTLQRGILLIELLVVIALVAILAVFAVPQISGLLADKDVKEAATTISQVIKQARITAKGQNTFVRVSFENQNNTPQIKLTTANDNTQLQLYKLPSRIEITAQQDFVFTPSGAVTAANGDNGILVTPTIRVSSSNATIRPIEISISSVGQLTSASLDQ